MAIFQKFSTLTFPVLITDKTNHSKYIYTHNKIMPIIICHLLNSPLRRSHCAPVRPAHLGASKSWMGQQRGRRWWHGEGRWEISDVKSESIESSIVIATEIGKYHHWLRGLMTLCVVLCFIRFVTRKEHHSAQCQGWDSHDSGWVVFVWGLSKDVGYPYFTTAVYKEPSSLFILENSSVQI